MAITFLSGINVDGFLSVLSGGITLSGTGRIQGVDTVSSNTDAANKLYVDNKFNGGVTQITAGTNVTISPSGGTGNVTINASGGGGGGTISGSAVNQEIAVGTAANTIGGQDYFRWTPQIGLVLGNNSQGGGANTITIDRPSNSPGRILIREGSTTEFSITTGGDTTIDTDANDLIISPNSSANVGIGNTSPSEKLEVTGRIKASAGVQVGTELDSAATSVTVGMLRYKLINGSAAAGTNYSYVDMVMQTGTTGSLSSYEWVNIVTNRW